MAVATRGGGVINEHFGHASEFLIYEASSRGLLLSVTARSTFTARGAIPVATAKPH